MATLERQISSAQYQLVWCCCEELGPAAGMRVNMSPSTSVIALQDCFGQGLLQKIPRHLFSSGSAKQLHVAANVGDHVGFDRTVFSSILRLWDWATLVVNTRSQGTNITMRSYLEQCDRPRGCLASTPPPSNPSTQGCGAAVLPGEPWDFTSSLRDQRKSTQIKHPDPVYLSRRVVFLRDTWTKPYTTLGE
ncbi:hypothetical protein PO909_029017 [Leuciscus waleckii]